MAYEQKREGEPNGAPEATDCDSVSDDGLQRLRGDLQQASHPPGFRLAEDASHLKRLALKGEMKEMLNERPIGPIVTLSSTNLI